MATIEQVVPSSFVELATMYDMRDATTVHGYLTVHADLIGVLGDLPAHASPYLPTIDRPVLEIVQDPDDEEDTGRIFALFPVRLDPSDALARLDRMRRDWWLDAYRRAGGRLNIDVEFR